MVQERVKGFGPDVFMRTICVVAFVQRKTRAISRHAAQGRELKVLDGAFAEWQAQNIRHMKRYQLKIGDVR
jgi:hypothetical protein